MLDTSLITTEITKLIAKGATEDALLAAAAYLFPNLTRRAAGRQVATKAAEKQATKTALDSTADREGHAAARCGLDETSGANPSRVI
jgi:hypothetical protein